MKIINSLLLLLDALMLLLLKSCAHVVQVPQSNYHRKFSLKTLVLFPKLTVIINNIAHKVARNNFFMKRSFFSSIYCLLTLCMSFDLAWIAKLLYLAYIS